jgi:hypothetical protein
VHLFRPSLGFLVEAQPRVENRRGQKALFGRGAHNVFPFRLGKNFEFIFDRYQVRLYKLTNIHRFSLLLTLHFPN